MPIIKLDPFDILPPRGANRKRFWQFVKREKRARSIRWLESHMDPKEKVRDQADWLLKAMPKPMLAALFAETSFLDEVRDEVNRVLNLPKLRPAEKDFRTAEEIIRDGEILDAAHAAARTYAERDKPKIRWRKLGGHYWPEQVS